MLTLGLRRHVGMGAVALVTATPSGPFTLAESETQQLTAVALNASGKSLSLVGRKVTWRSTDTDVATVSAAGLVTAVAEGDCDVHVAVDGVESAALEVSVAAAPAALTPVFFSDWAAQSGTTSTAISDGSKWNAALSADFALIGEIIASTGLDFPTAKVLWVKGVQTRDGFLLPRKTGMAIPDVGDRRYYRWYINVGLPDDLPDNEQHPIQDGNNASTSNWMFKVVTNVDGEWTPRLHLAQTATNAVYSATSTLTKGETYRCELQVHRTGTTTFEVHIRIYDSSDVLVMTDADFEADGGASLAANPSITFSNVGYLEGLNCGSNGITDPYPDHTAQSYQGGFAVCDNQGWIGPYGSVDGEAA